MSVAANIRTAVKDAIDALALSGITKVVKRKRPVYLSGDGDAVIVVSGMSEVREPLTAEDDAAYMGKYGIAVTVIRPNAAVEGTQDSVDDWREAIAKRLTMPNPLPTVPEVSNVEQLEKPWFSMGPLDKNYDYLPLAFILETVEAR